jgi:hypothetical protein
MILNSGKACYHSIQNILPSCVLSKNVNIKTYKTVIFPVVLYGCETLSVALREEHRLKVVLLTVYGSRHNRMHTIKID